MQAQDADIGTNVYIFIYLLFLFCKDLFEGERERDAGGGAEKRKS